MRSKKLESTIQSEARDYAKIRGWWCIKVETPSMNGVPDFLYLRDGEYIWIEWKKPGGGLSAIQNVRIKEMRAHGATVYVLDNIGDAKVILR